MIWVVRAPTNPSEDQVELFRPRLLEGGLSIRRGLHLVPLRLQVELQAKRDGRLVFHYQYSFHVASLIGSKTVKVLPRPGSLSRRFSPSRASTMWRALARFSLTV
jgi:hypothetical protein